MSDCIFCKIVDKEIPTEFLYEDETCVIFPDINPAAKTHLLVVPKKHIPTIADLEEGDEKIVGHMVKKAKDIAKEKGLTGYKLQFNVGKDGGQEIFHIHLHLTSTQG
ncbi:histidine triad nucleotide-binding protein [Candidatus Peregrinibacteria bacterium]|jgi:histidine triad (HIT) family protein|nr:histidine triad nucleotide-binding protein [Candidatus Peregrinibacteria bacterium]MBT4055696.1 histidine triad nucleotide-binding protein [Candidatus Peregrinibacteria bacterium]